MPQLYKHNGKMVNMTPEDVGRALSEAETKLRTGKFSYDNNSKFIDIKAGIESWPKDLKGALVATGRAMSPGQPITPSVIMAAMNATLRQFVAPARAAAKGKIGESAVDAEARALAAEAGLSWMLGVAPDVKVGGPRDFLGRKILAKPFLRLGRMVVDVSEVGNADVYVYSFYNRDVNRAIMVGWVTGDDLRAAPKGNRSTDEENCKWREMAHYIPLAGLRPMSELLAAMKISSTYDGILMERVPSEADVPVPSNANFDAILKGDDGKDFWKDIGVDEETVKRIEGKK